ncbi:Retrovirus-related Pol polyprotein from transposon RE2, partial [Bienertia sinuspersici]
MAAERENMTVDITNPLYLHPNEGPLLISEKLQGITNYRSWKRSVEIALAGKRKLGFVTGLVTRDPTDKKKQEQWDICNNIVISWLHASMSEPIKKSVLYLDSARNIWIQLEKHFTVSNDAAKYRLNKALYYTEQGEMSINEYFTKMSSIWEEIEDLNQLPAITHMNPEIRAFVEALNKRREEEHLFQFLNGLNEDYAQQRSQLLMQTPLPTVEGACSSLQQEEAREKISAQTRLLRNHTSDRCWKVIGYPKGHPLAKSQSKGQKKVEESKQNWKKVRSAGARTAASATTTSSQGENSNTNYSLTPQQVEQLLKLLPGNQSSLKTTSDTDDEIETSFGGMVSCFTAFNNNNHCWILDSGASDHMVCDKSLLINSQEVKNSPKIRLPNNETVRITHIGDVELNESVRLSRVICVPEFKHNLISANKLVKSGDCQVIFYPEFCVIQDSASRTIKGVGKAQNGLYFLVNRSRKDLKNCYDEIVKQQKEGRNQSYKDMTKLTYNLNKGFCNVVTKRFDDAVLWHNRLGHTPMKKV